MKRIPELVLIASLATSASAASTDWVSYLCRYKTGEIEYAQVVKVNEKQQRVTLDDRDATAVKFTANAINFGGPRGDWIITRPSGDMLTMRGVVIGKGKCEKIED
jgi:hypothetical protein